MPARVSGASEKVMQTFRMQRDLVAFLRREATKRGADLTGHVVRYLEGIRTWFGLPVAATALLEADRKALGLERYEYLLHLLYQRSLQLRVERPGFDGGGAEGKKRSR
jgi:hypothetical protein